MFKNNTIELRLQNISGMLTQKECRTFIITCQRCFSIIFILFLYWIILQIYFQWGKILFDPLLILYVCPLTKKWSVYNFNGRFIWTVRNRITTKKIQKNTFKKSYKLISILMSVISIWSPINQHFWLPGVFYTGKELRLEQSLKGRVTCIKDNMSTEAINQSDTKLYTGL